MIDKSVGSFGANIRDDVLIVQTALNASRSRMKSRPISVDGLVGPETIGAITHFQQINRLTTDGRVDPDGRTIKTLRSTLSEEAAIFAPTVAQLLSELDHLTRLSLVAPQRVQADYQTVISRMAVLRKFRDLAPSGPSQPPGLMSGLTSGLTSGPPVIGFTGAEEGAAAFALMLLALSVASMLLIMSQSPAFRKAVEVRAKELDRLLIGLKFESVGFFEGAVELVNLVLTESSAKQNECRQSPTFTPSPECEEAIRKFAELSARIVGQVHVIKGKIAFFLVILGMGGASKELVELRGLVRRALDDAFNLQFKKSDMKDKCKCREV